VDVVDTDLYMPDLRDFRFQGFEIVLHLFGILEPVSAFGNLLELPHHDMFDHKDLLNAWNRLSFSVALLHSDLL
jgi:hypothetical protein